ncbi:MAG: HAD family hydrolase [Sphingomonas sp.]
MGPRAVIFDVGHVLYDWNPRYLYKRLIQDDRALDAFLRDICTLDWHFQHDLGRDFAETSAELIAAHPDHADLIRAWGERWIEQIGDPLPGMPTIVDDLAAANVPMFALTNYGEAFWQQHRARDAWLFDRFQGFVVSGTERLIKPDPAIYRLALERFRLTAAEVFFVDDRQANVDAATALGIHARLFTGADDLRRDLCEVGLLAA